MLDRGTLGGEGTSQGAEGINERGEIVGGSNTATGELHSFLWTSASGMVDITPTARFSRAFAINNAGQVVGRSTPEKGRLTPSAGRLIGG
jgi:probable HAF family extracellular repeat protein